MLRQLEKVRSLWRCASGRGLAEFGRSGQPLEAEDAPRLLVQAVGPVDEVGVAADRDLLVGQRLVGDLLLFVEAALAVKLIDQHGDVAVLIDELYGQRSFNEQQQIPDESLADEQIAVGRYTHFIDRAYRLDEQPWGIFSLERLTRTPEFRQAAA